MKTKKENTTSKESISKNFIKNKQRILRPKAGFSLVKTVENVQQILKKKKAEATIAKKKKVEATTAKKKKTQLTSSKVNRFKVRKFQKDKGIVYIGHIPHGFYEEQMKEFFGQFGKVTHVRVARSEKNGKSRGYGYVEFLSPDVAKIVAETMNNYLMCGRLLKATCISREKQHARFFAGKNWSEDKYPKLKNRAKAIVSSYRVQNTEDHDRYVKRSLHKLTALENKLQCKGISIKFQPVDTS